MIDAVRWKAVAWLVCWILGPAASVHSQCEGPYHELSDRSLVYHGPGREAPAPDVDAIRLGYFGPDDADEPGVGDLWDAARLAIDEANALGGHDGRRFELVPIWSSDPWGTGVTHLVRAVYEERLWAIVGGVDGPSTHLAAQVVAKARLPLVSPGGTAKTKNLAGVPWVFSCLPPDHRIAPRLVQSVVSRGVPSPLVVVSATDHDSACFTEECKVALHARGIGPSFQFDIDPNGGNIAVVVDQVMRSRPRTVAISADPLTSASLVVALRGTHFAGMIVGGPSFARGSFRERIGAAVGPLHYPRMGPRSNEAEAFDEAFTNRYARRPDYAAAAAYDAVQIVVEAIRRAGLNRARIGDAIRGLSPWDGASGTIAWDGLGFNNRMVSVERVPEGERTSRRRTTARAGGEP